MADLHLDFIDYKKIFKDREKRLKLINKLSFIPTKPYLKAIYWLKTGHKLDLNNPKTFTEKINWLKLNSIHPEYCKYVDKYEFKQLMSEKYGSEHVIKLLGVYDHFNEIDFDILPNQFVLKCTHDSGSIKIIKDKSQVNKKELEEFFENRLEVDQYNLSREYPYKNVKPRIIVEELYTTKKGTSISDYKFLCFNGKVKLFYVVSDRNDDEKETWFTRDLKINDEIYDPTSPVMDLNFKLPECINDMVSIAEELSTGMPFVRVDMYENDNKFYFGEMTFFHCGGFVRFQPEKYEKLLGSWIEIE